MYYETNPKKNQKKKQKQPEPQLFVPKPKQPKARKKRGCITGLMRLLIWLGIFCFVAYIAAGLWVRVGFLSGHREDLAANAKLPSGYTHVLLLGADENNGGERSRTDSIMVASFGDDGDIRLTSFMRDTMVNMGDRGTHKLNAAYRIGGGDLAMYAINSAFGLNVAKYAVVDFQGIAKVIDAMGGIELDITEKERDEINKGLRKAYQKKRVFNGVLMKPIEDYGKKIHMSGTHALFYARIRSIDSDFQRASRQRTLLSAMLGKLKANPNPLTLGSVMAAALSCVETNLNPVDLGALGIRALASGEGIAQCRIPQEGAYTQGMEDGVWMIRANFAKCRQHLYDFIYS